MSVTLKIVVCGPKGVGKSTICNGICDYNNPIPSDYKQTRSVRILECEQEFNEEQIKNNSYLKNKGLSKCNIQLWDMGGDKCIEKLWPAIKNEAHGAILIIDGKSSKHDNMIDEWVNGFCNPGIDVDNIACIAYSKETTNKTTDKISNQFPKMKIYETNYDLNNILPIFHHFVDHLISKLS